MKTDSKWIVANWKMNGTQDQVRSFLDTIRINTKGIDCGNLIFCPPFVYLMAAAQELKAQISELPYLANNLSPSNFYDAATTAAKLGAQDVGAFDGGPYTGDIAPYMLKDCGVTHVIIGHSERRIHHQESPHLLRQKLEVSFKNGLIPIFCIGESLVEYQQKQTLAVLTNQLTSIDIIAKEAHEHQNSLISQQPLTYRPYFVAYEPIWSIGTGMVPTLKEIRTIHQFLRLLPGGAFAQGILYGGSVNGNNAQDILSLPEVDGVLIGGASLQHDVMTTLIKGLFS